VPGLDSFKLLKRQVRTSRETCLSNLPAWKACHRGAAAVAGRCVTQSRCCDDNCRTKRGANRQLRAGLISSDALVTEKVHASSRKHFVTTRTCSRFFEQIVRKICDSRKCPDRILRRYHGKRALRRAYRPEPVSAADASHGMHLTGKLKKAPTG
jgi:hypothetical protein